MFIPRHVLEEKFREEIASGFFSETLGVCEDCNESDVVYGAGEGVEAMFGQDFDDISVCFACGIYRAAFRLGTIYGQATVQGMLYN
jgi:hypothetical protein